MRVSLKDIAKYTGLSQTTVSLHLNKHQLSGRLSATTKAKIDEAVKKFDYVPSYAARAMASGKTQTIGFVVGDLALPRPSLMASALLNETSKNGVQLLISATQFSPEKEIACLKDLRNRRADGIIFPLGSIASDTKVYNSLVEEHYPMILIFNRDKNFHSIENDLGNAMKDAVSFFRSSGANEVTIIADGNLLNNHDGMYISFIKACEESKCTPHIEPVSAASVASIDACLERISRNPPDFLIVQGMLLMNILEQRLRRYQNKFPRIVGIIDNWEPPPVRNEILAGVIMCYPDRITKKAIDFLRRLINTPLDSSIPFLVKEPAEFLLSWPGDSSPSTADEVKRMMGCNGSHNWEQ